MMQRKNKPPAPRSVTAEGPDAVVPPAALGPSSSSSAAGAAASSSSSNHHPPKQSPGSIVAARRATVVRRRCGTSPFDDSWLNVDCCGLFCAGFTYCLHAYGVYAVVRILIPPWMSYLEEGEGSDATRKLTIWGTLNCVAFTGIAAMAVVSHFLAMTTDPGAVPPDAAPLPEPEETAPLLPIRKNGDEGGASASNNGAGASSASASKGGDGGAAAALSGPAAVAGAVAAVGAGMAVAGAAAVSAAMTSKPMVGGTGLSTGVRTTTTAARGRRICRRCNAYKPARAHHCSVCKRCIIKMDHHCPWVNNCVGIGNHKYFLLFIFYTFLSCLYSMSLCVLRFVQCLGSAGPRHGGGHCLDEPTHILNVIGLMVEALLFGLFTSCMMIDQWDVVMTNVTHIDRLKGETGFATRNDPRRRGINEVFGTGRFATASASNRFRPDWLSPFVGVCFPSSVHDEIMGFCRPCLGGGKEKEDDDLEGGGIRVIGGGRRRVGNITEIV